MERIAVTGANGKTGRAVMAAASARRQIRALARDRQQAESLESLGHDVIVGDMTQPAVLAELFDGVGAVYHICPNFHPAEEEIGRLVATAAAHVDRLVYHSVLHPQTEAMPHHWRKLRVEEMLLRCRPGRVTFLRPAPYVQNLLPYLKVALSEGELRIPYSVETSTAMVDLVDVGAAAVAALGRGVEPGSGWDLCGVAAVSHRQLAERLSGITGLDITAVAVPIESGAPADVRRMFRYMGAHGLPASTGQLEAIIGEPTPLDDTLERLVAAVRDGGR